MDGEASHLSMSGAAAMCTIRTFRCPAQPPHTHTGTQSLALKLLLPLLAAAAAALAAGVTTVHA